MVNGGAGPDGTPRRRAPWRGRATAGVALALTLAAGAAAWYLHSDAFHRALERYVLGQIAEGSGARVTASGMQVSLNPLRLELDGLVMHGREAGNQPPLATIPRLLVRLRLRDLLHWRIGIERVQMETPRFRIYRLADGDTNLPEPLAPWSRRAQEARTLFSLGANDLAIEHGELDLGTQRIPFNLGLRDLELKLAATRGGYTGQLRFSALDTGRRIWQRGVSAAAQFNLTPQALSFTSVTLRDSGLQIAASGTLNDFTQPAITANYRLAAYFARLPMDLRQRLHGATGVLQAQGSWHWSQSGWMLGGRANATAVGAAGEKTGTWSGRATWQAAPAGLEIAQLEARRGTEYVALSGRYQGWRTLDLNGSFGGLDLASVPALLASAGVQSRWLKLLRQFDASAKGNFQLQGQPGDRFRPRVGIQVRLQPKEGRGTAIGGTISAGADTARRTLQLLGLDLQAAGARLQASGTLAAGAASLQVQFGSEALEQLRPLAAAAAAIAGWRLADFAGSAQFHGNLHGRLSQPVINGKLELTGAHWGARRVDALTLAGTITPDTLNLTQAELRLGSEQVRAAGLISLDRYRIVPASSLRMTGNVQGVSLANMQAWAGVSYPLSGTLSASASATGTLGQPEAQGHVAVQQARWRGQAIPAVTADLRLHAGQLSTRDLAIELPRTRITGSVTLGLKDRNYALHLQSGGVALSGIAMLQSPRLAIRGQMRFQLSGSGTWDRPQGQLILTTAGLRGNGESLGDVGAQMELNSGQVKFHLADILPNGSFNLNGTVAAAAPYTTHAQLELHNYDFDAWLERFTPAELSGHSQVSGSATLDGPLAQPSLLAVRVALDPVQLALGGLTIHNQGPIVIVAAQRRLTLQPARIVAPDTDFTLQGSAALSDVLRSRTFLGALTGSLAGHINLALVHSLHPETGAAGEVGVSASLSGTLERPNIRGEVTISNASLSEAALPLVFDDIQGELALNGRRVDVRSLTAHTGGGNVAITGFAAETSAGVNFDLRASGQNLRLRYQGVSATGDLQLRLSGQPASALLAGTAQLNRIALDPNFDLALFLANSAEPAAPPNPDSTLNHIRMDVHLVTGPQVEVATNVAHLQLQADVHLRGTLAQPSVLGRASASEGRILFAGNQYQVTKAQVQFVNPFRIEPLVDVSLSTAVQQYDITLNIAGPPDKLAINYRSDPPLASADVMSLLATGQTTQAGASLANEQSTFAPSEQILGQALNNLVAGRLHRLFGITQVQVNPDTGVLGPTGSGGTVTVEQQVSRNLKLTYTQNLSSSSQDIIQVDWTISRSLGITLNRDQFGLYGLKFTLRQRAR